MPPLDVRSMDIVATDGAAATPLTGLTIWISAVELETPLEVNVAVTVVLETSENAQEPVPGHEPEGVNDQPVKVELGSAVAERETELLAARVSVQIEPQLMPEPEIVPLPVPVLVAERVKDVGPPWPPASVNNCWISETDRARLYTRTSSIAPPTKPAVPSKKLPTVKALDDTSAPLPP